MYMHTSKKLIPLLFAVLLTFAACSVVRDDKNSDSGPNSSVEAGHSHRCVKMNANASTCLEEGNIEYWACIACNKIFTNQYAEEELEKEDVIVQKLPHSCDHVEEVDATCATEGNIEYWSCSVCSTYFADESCGEIIEDKDSVKVGKKVHALEHIKQVQPVGKQDGNIEYWYCSLCENYYADADCMDKIEQIDTVLLAPYNIPDFVVEVDEGKEPVVLQLSDTQIIDAGQTRPGRTGVDYTFWATDQIEERCYDYLTETINATKPDFIIITGDVIYGEFDDSGTALLSFIEFMDSFQIPWSPIFGNHDNESKKGVDWQCEQFENAEYCLFEQKTLTGNGNYSVAIAQGGVLKRVFYLLDSNGCGAASVESFANGHTKASVGFGEDQIDWYTQQIMDLKAVVPDVKISFAYHIQQAVFADAYAKYGFVQAEKYQDINIDIHPDRADTDFGYIGRQLKNPWDSNYRIFNGMKELGCDSIFVGHEHCNSSSVVYEGVRFQCGQKSSDYDRFNCIAADGTITGGYSKTSTSLIGGTVIPLSKEDGSILSPYIYYCGFENGEIDWSDYEVKESVTVNGLQYGGVNITTAEMWTDGAVTAESVKFDETTNAYAVTANTQGKLYVNVGLMKGKTSFTFTVYVPETATAKLSGYGEFAIRVKPNTGEPSLDGKVDGYIDFDSVAMDEELKLELGQWKTFMVDITGLDATCTEFSFVIAQGNTIYLKDVVFN